MNTENARGRGKENFTRSVSPHTTGIISSPTSRMGTLGHARQSCPALRMEQRTAPAGLMGSSMVLCRPWFPGARKLTAKHAASASTAGRAGRSLSRSFTRNQSRNSPHTRVASRAET